jgi:hypothetical protein
MIVVQNAIDLDQEAMEVLLATATKESYEQALAVYTKGGFSKSVAQVTLSSPLKSRVPASTKVSGVTADGDEVAGVTYEEYSSGATAIEFEYQTSDIQATYVGCQVGGNPNPFTDGCLAPTGNVTIEKHGSYAYTYDPLAENVNKRTLQGFSTQAEEKMYRCKNCPYSTYEKFYDYYGVFDYANQWVLAAFAGSSTAFANGNADFSPYGFDGKTEAIKKGTAFMNVWMYVIREMEDALDDCQEGCTLQDCNMDPVNAWDEAVAFYSGSLEGTDGAGSGKLLHELADKRCANFKTCGEFAADLTGLAHVNVEIFREFSIGINKLLTGECSSAREQKERIETMMAVPLIQGSLRYAYITDHEDGGEKAEAEGATFAAAVLPLVHACNEEAATTIYNNLKVGQGASANFAVVKDAFESTYECLGVRCQDVGGLWDTETGDYYPGAAPCGSSSSSSSAANVGLIVGLTVGGVVFLALVYVVSSRRRGNKTAEMNAAVEQAKVEPTEQPGSQVM